MNTQIEQISPETQAFASKIIKELFDAGYKPKGAIKVLKMATYKFELLKASKMNMNCITVLQNELARYKTQQSALKNDKSYDMYEEERALLNNFYSEKIKEYQIAISKETAKIKDIEVREPFIYKNTTG